MKKYNDNLTELFFSKKNKVLAYIFRYYNLNELNYYSYDLKQLIYNYWHSDPCQLTYVSNLCKHDYLMLEEQEKRLRHFRTKIILKIFKPYTSFYKKDTIQFNVLYYKLYAIIIHYFNKDFIINKEFLECYPINAWMTLCLARRTNKNIQKYLDKKWQHVLLTYIYNY